MIMVWEEQQITGTPQSGAGGHWDLQGKCRETWPNKAGIVLPQRNHHLAACPSFHRCRVAALWETTEVMLGNISS